MNDLSAERRRLLEQRLGRKVSAAARPAAEDIPRLDQGIAPPLSAGQTALRYEHRLRRGEAVYNVTHRYRIPGHLDTERFTQALSAVVDRHEPLHTAFDAERTRLTSEQALHVEAITCDPDELKTRSVLEAETPFDLEHGPLVRAVVADHGDGTHGLLLSLHHVSCDAGSLRVFWNDLDRFYQGETLEPITVSYAAHATWQAAKVTPADIDYWTKQIVGHPNDDHTNSPELGTVAATDRPSGYLTRPLRSDLLSPAGVSTLDSRPLAIFVSAYAALLQRYTDRAAPLVGVTMSTRDHPATEALVGYFLTVLPYRIDVGELSFRELAHAVDSQLGTGLARRHVPYSSVINAARDEIDGEPGDALKAMFVFDQAHQPELDGHTVEGAIQYNGTAVAPVTLFVRPHPETGWEAGLEYDGAIMGRDDAIEFLAQYAATVDSLLESPDAPVVTVGLSTDYDDVGPPVTPKAEPIIDLVAGHAIATGDKPAVRCGDDALSYDGLLAQADVLAQHLVDRGITPGDRVAVSLPRSTATVVAILGIHRAGAAYVPVDVTYPPARRALILETAAPAAVVTTTELATHVDHLDIVVLDDLLARAEQTTGATLPAASLDDPAYVIYTSGSTGVPRGVEISQRQLAVSTMVRSDCYAHAPERFLVVSSVGFDSSIVGLFWTLSVGGEVVLPTEAQVHDVDELAALFGNSGATHTLMVPSLWDALLRRGAQQLDAVRVAIVAGEACHQATVRRHYDTLPATELVNEYGPTEATVWASYHRCEPHEDPVPIGRAIPGATLRVADRWLRPKPDGVSGELLISSPGVASGYVDDAASTAAAFVVDGDERRWYRSGDLVRRSVAGPLQYLGRIDEQLSIGGVRIEPGEIERVIQSVSGVTGAAVLVPDDSSGQAGRTDNHGRRALVAFVESATATPAQIRDECLANLPAAVVPTRFDVRATLPRSAHGKIDRTTLAAEPISAAAGSGLAPRSPSPAALAGTTATVSELWRAALGMADADADTDFFDAGGDSLSAVELAESLEKSLGRPVSIGSVVDARTPRQFVEQLGTERLTDAEGRPLLREILRYGDDRPPLVVFDGAPGQPVGYAHMARAMDPEQPIVGLRLPGVDDSEPLVRSIAAQAERMLPEILALDDRPISLMGLSTGGLLALEIGQRLTQLGRQPNLVVMADTIFPGRQHLEWESPRAHFERVSASASNKLAAIELYKRFRSKVRDERQRLEVKLHERFDRPLTNPGRNRRLNDIAFATELGYRPRRYDGRVIFFAAATTSAAMTTNPWSEVLTDLEIVPIEGQHHLIVKDPTFVGPLANALQERLDQFD